MFVTIIGILCIIYGLVLAYLRVKKPDTLYKYAAMQKKFGKNGAPLHFIAYTVIPIIFGLVLIF